MRLAWRTLGLGLLVMASAACEDGINFCSERDDAGNCPDFPDLIADGGMDAKVPPSDASPADTGTADGNVADAMVGMDAAAASSFNVEEFCDAKYRVAKAWRDKLEACCFNNSGDDRSLFLVGGLLYEDGTGTAEESVADCVAKLNAQIGPNLEFSATAAVACATKFAAQFVEPPATCPSPGFQIDVLEAMLGKQSQELTQLAECRAALAGKLNLNAACTGHYQCKAGMRCLSGTCRDAVGNGGPCGFTEQCADGLVCIGVSSGSGRACRPKDQLAAVTAPCTFSVECGDGAFCSENQCLTASARAICAP